VLADALADKLHTRVIRLDLADYASMNDEVTYADIRCAMDLAWTDQGLPRRSRGVDAVVHSTGALVIRDWMTQFAPADNPICNLVMLAPANFGSPLAHKGRSFWGRAYKGVGWSRQVGERVLRGLELASPYTWDLAFRDRFTNRTFYGPGRTLCTVLVGNKGYGGARGMVNEEGGDGTVRVSTANLECSLLTIRLDQNPPSIQPKRSTGETAFCVLEGEDHASIISPDVDELAFELITGGLQVNDRGWRAWADRLHDLTQVAMDNGREDGDRHGFQNTVVRLRDDLGHSVKDYVVEFTLEDHDTFIKFFHQGAIRSVHKYCEDPSYRSIYVNCTTLYDRLDRMDEHLRIKLFAEPELADNARVGYVNDDAQRFDIRPDRLPGLFLQNRTLLVDVTIKRHHQGVFTFTQRP